MIILDFSSGETCNNDLNEVHRMIDGLAEVDSRRENVIIKWQLEVDPPYIPEAGRRVKPLDRDVFVQAYYYAMANSYFTTASVFDEESLSFLLQFNIPFIKIANKPYKYHLLEKIPRNKTVFVSIGPGFKKEAMSKQYPNVKYLHCISEYPADPTTYETGFGQALSYSISDHTPANGFYLYAKYQPYYYETHYRLEDSGGLDNGPWAKTPRELERIL